MRHGHSPSSAEAGVPTDALRPLSENGRRDARRVAEEIVRRGGNLSLILHSPLVRAASTAQEAAAALHVQAEVFAPLDNTLSPEAALAKLRERGGQSDSILAVGHQPQIGEMAALLTGDVFDVRPAGLIAIEFAPTPRLLWSLNVDELA